MAQETHNHLSEPSSTECGDFDIADEIEWACTRLQDTMRDETAAYESLESLFKKRREDAVEAVKKAQSHLQFVNEEEARLRKKLGDRPLFGAKSGSNAGNTQAGSTKQDSHQERANKPSNLEENSAIELVSSQGKSFAHRRVAWDTYRIAVSSLNSYLASSEILKSSRIISRKEAEKKVVALRQLIAKYEKPTGPVHAGFIGGPEGVIKQYITNPDIMVVSGAAQRVTEVPSIGDVSVLKERLEGEESMLTYYDDDIQKLEMQMATYRRFIAAEGQGSAGA